MIYDLGDPVTLRHDVLADGAPAVAGGVTLTVRQPDSTTLNVAVTTPQVGLYTATFTPTQDGSHTYRWVVTGTGAGVEDGTLTVLPAFYVQYASPAEVRERLPGQALDDTRLRTALHAARQRIERYTGDVFTPTLMTVRARVSDGVAHLPYRVRSVSAVSFASSGLPLASNLYAIRTSTTPGDRDALQLHGYGLDPNVLATVEPFRTTVRVHRDLAVLVTGLFGWEQVPDEVRLAAIELAAASLSIGGVGAAGEVNSEGDASLGVAPAVPVVEVGPNTGSTTGHPHVDALLAPYRRSPVRIS